MPVDTLPAQVSPSAIAKFRAAPEACVPSHWTDEDCFELFRFTSVRTIPAGEALIRHGEPDRTLYFVLGGELEIILPSGDAFSMGRVAEVGPGSVLGELAFFDGGPRSAGAWAVRACEVAAMPPDQYAAFERSHPDLARDLLFALGRILAIRLRRANSRTVR
jgi:CRP/FNR family transcriptional regulator, cyclic AMP receptor protein